MVRVKSDCNVKAAVKAPRKATALGAKSPATPKNNSKKNSAGNSYCPRQTPEWQKPITSFFSKTGTQGESTEEITLIDDTFGDPVASSSPVPCCSKDDIDQFEDEEISKNGQKEKGPVTDTAEPVPCCSKDTVEDEDLFEDEEKSENGHKEIDPVTDTVEPVPGCSKDSVNRLEEGEENSENDQKEMSVSDSCLG